MARLIKLTDRDYKTRRGYPNETLWGENVTHSAKGRSMRLCTSGVIHAHSDLLVALFMNPAISKIDHLVPWIAEGEIVISDPIKVGCKTLTTLWAIRAPTITLVQRVAFGILCTKQVYKNEQWLAWANKWLSNIDRSSAASYAASAAAGAYAASAAADAAADYICSAAYEAMTIT